MKLSNYDWDYCFNFKNINEITDAWSNSFLNKARECIFITRNCVSLRSVAPVPENLLYDLIQTTVGTFIDNFVTNTVEQSKSVKIEN